MRADYMSSILGRLILNHIVLSLGFTIHFGGIPMQINNLAHEWDILLTPALFLPPLSRENELSLP